MLELARPEQCSPAFTAGSMADVIGTFARTGAQGGIYSTKSSNHSQNWVNPVTSECNFTEVIDRHQAFDFDYWVTLSSINFDSDYTTYFSVISGTNSVKGVLNDAATLHKYLYSGLSQTDFQKSGDLTNLDHNNAPNLNGDNLTEAWAQAQKKLIGDCTILNNSDLTNDGPLIANNYRLLQDMATNDSNASTKQCASLVEEGSQNSSIPPQFEPKNDVFWNQKEYQTSPLKRIWEKKWKSLNYEDTAHPFEAHLHTTNYAGPNLDLTMAYKAPNFSKNGDKIQMSQLYKSSSFPTFDEILPIKQTGEGFFPPKNKVLKLQLAAENLKSNSEGTTNKDSPRSILRRLQVCTVTHDPAFSQTLNYTIGATAMPFGIPTYSLNGCGGEILNGYFCRCIRENDEVIWSPTPDFVISSTGGSIFEEDIGKVGNYTCQAVGVTSPSRFYDGNFTFSLTMSLPTVPDPPINLTAISANTTSTSTAFSWTAPVNDGGSNITGYEIQWDQGEDEWVQLVASQTATSYTKTGLLGGKTFQFKVSAINSLGTSTPSSLFSIATTTCIITRSALPWSSINYKIGSPEFSFAIPTYTMTTGCSAEETFDYSCQCINSESNSWILSGITVTGGSIYDTTVGLLGNYTCRVNATTTSGAVENTFTFQLTMGLPTVPDPPTALTEITESTNSSSIEFLWSAPANDGGSPVIGYEIQWNNGIGTQMEVYDEAYTGGTSLILTGLTSDTTYQFQIAAINSIGRSSLTSMITITTTSICTVTYNQTFTQSPINYTIGATAMPFGIPTYSLNGCGGEILNGYFCRCIRENDGVVWSPSPDFAISSTGGSIGVGNTTLVGNYTCQVVAVTSPSRFYDGNFTFSLTMSLLTVPDPPINLTAISANTTSTSIAFSWTAPVNDGGSNITGYEIQWDQGEDDWVQLEATDTAKTSYTKTGLLGGKTYQFKVSAINSVGTSTPTSILIRTNTCIITRSNLSESSINYKIGSPEVSFAIPTYTMTTGCSVDETFVSYSCECVTSDLDSWTAQWNTVSRGSIFETTPGSAGNYTCRVNAATSSGAIENTFYFSLTMSLPTVCSSIQLQESLPLTITYTIGSTLKLDYPKYTLIPENCQQSLSYSIDLLSWKTNDYFKENPNFNKQLNSNPSFMTWDNIRILLQGSDSKESWNSFIFKITATDQSNITISDSSYNFTVNTQPNCLDVKFSLPSSFSNTISYTMESPNKHLLYQVIESKSISTGVPFICGPVTMQLNQTDIYAATSTSLPDFVIFDQASQSLMIQASKAKVGTFYLLLDIFFEFFKVIPSQTHRQEKIKLLIDPGLLKQYMINATAVDEKTPKANLTDEASQKYLEVEKPAAENPNKVFDLSALSSISNLSSLAPNLEPIIGDKMKVTTYFENLVKQKEFEDQNYYFYRPTYSSGTSSQSNLELKAKVDYISASGNVEVKFNQEVVFPDNFLTVVNYLSNRAQMKRHLCSDCVMSQNMTAEELNLIAQFRDKPLISLGLYVGQFSLYESRNLNYTWNTTSVDKKNNKFTISLTFDEPEAISATSEPDFLEVTFNFKNFFKSAKGDVLKTDHALKLFPSIIDGNFDSVQSFADSCSIMTTVLILSTAAINLILSVSLSLMWTLINVMQLLVCLPLVNVNYPANSLIFNKIFISIANFQMIPVGGMLEKFFLFGPQVPFSQSFYSIGTKSHSLMLNLGLPFVTLIGSLLFLLPICLLTKKLGIRYFFFYRIYRKLREKLKFNFYLRMIFEIFIHLAITSLVNLYNVKQAWKEDSKWGDKLSVVLAFIFLAVIIIAPFWTAYIIRKHKNKLQSEEFTSKYGELTEGLKFENRYDSVWFLTRRLITAMIIVHFRGFGYFQIIFLTYLQTAQIIYIGMARPYKKSQTNYQHLVNEYLVIVCIYHLLWYTDWVTTVDPQLSYNAGWSQCAIIFVIVFMSMFILVWQSLQKIKKACRKKQIKKLKLEQKNKKSKAAPELIENVPQSTGTAPASTQTVPKSTKIEAKIRKQSRSQTVLPIKNNVQENQAVLPTLIQDRNTQNTQVLQRQRIKGKQLSSTHKVSKSSSKVKINKEYKQEQFIEEEKVVVVRSVRKKAEIVPMTQIQIQQRKYEEEYMKELNRKLDKMDEQMARQRADMLLSVSNDSSNLEESQGN